MLIRVEIPIDAPGIDALLRRSFESDAEAKLVHDLREDGFLTLGWWRQMTKVRSLAMWHLVRLMCRAKTCNGSAWHRWRLMKNTVDRAGTPTGL